ncbi:uncharacterized protein LOC133308601 [Gastrolobium bilobum]|uniref:uncharacterized protein LOC133308601 n=1 Tax=Gastrolobium bilobum TaxID=150636 RepID=UPI002AB1FBA5|nr:uncharacterized protein LOC133308601 [Gastrolobium bilobum]
MEYFNKAKAVKLRSHLGKYLVGDEDQDKIHQSRKGSTKKAIWVVELVEGKSHRVRLRSCHGRYLTATDMPFLLGMTGDKVVQAELDAGLDWKYEWEPIREGLQVKLRSWCGKYLRGNGGTPPWRNSITHDDPYSSKTHNWILWGVEAVEFSEKKGFFAESVVSSSDSDEILGSEPPSPMSVSSVESSLLSHNSKLKVRVHV